MTVLSFKILYILVLQRQIDTTVEKKVSILRAYTKIYKICKLHRSIFLAFYNISQPNCAILPTLYAVQRCCYELYYFELLKNFAYYAIGQLNHTAFSQWWKQVCSPESPFKDLRIVTALSTVGRKRLANTLHRIFTLTCVISTVFHKLARIHCGVTSAKGRCSRFHVITQIHVLSILSRCFSRANCTTGSLNALWVGVKRVI
jgi:hypothetical protein